jgi:hypothetical protein
MNDIAASLREAVDLYCEKYRNPALPPFTVSQQYGMTPTLRGIDESRARMTIGHATAAPPTSMINLRRLISRLRAPGLCFKDPTRRCRL